MKEDTTTTQTHRKMIVSTLWIVIMLNMVFADILGFMIPGALAEIMTGYGGAVPLTEQSMLIAGIFLEIPIAMIFLSRILKYKANRIANIIASIITIVFVIGGGSLELQYIFFATIETVCMVGIIWYVIRWPKEEI